jgi:transcriptional regulator with XRE-family HTH domain
VIDIGSGCRQDAAVTEPEVDQFYKEFGHRVRLARERAGVTQAHLAAAVGLTRSSVANLEAGRQKILLHVLLIMANLLDVEPVELLPEYDEESVLDLAKLDNRLRDFPDDHRDFVLKTVRVMARGGTDGAS